MCVLSGINDRADNPLIQTSPTSLSTVHRTRGSAFFPVCPSFHIGEWGLLLLAFFFGLVDFGKVKCRWGSLGICTSTMRVIEFRDWTQIPSNQIVGWPEHWWWLVGLWQAERLQDEKCVCSNVWASKVRRRQRSSWSFTGLSLGSEQSCCL